MTIHRAASEAVKAGVDSPKLPIALAVVGIGVGLPAIFVSPVAGSIIAAAIIVVFAAIGVYSALLQHKFGEPYQVLRSEITWEIADAQGATATQTKKRKLRFLQDNVIAIWEGIWPASAPPERYSCDQGAVKADEFLDGDRKQVLISLRSSRKRGEEMDLTTTRVLSNRFTEHEAWVAADANVETRELVMRVIFPLGRPPNSAFVKSNRGAKKHPLQAQGMNDGRQVLFREFQPKRKETYYINWTW